MSGSKKSPEDGVIENIFVVLAVILSVLCLGSFSKEILVAQRYQTGLDLGTESAVRTLISEGSAADAQMVAQSELENIMREMNLSTNDLVVTVSGVAGRCGTFSVSAYTTLRPTVLGGLPIRLSARQDEPADPLASGIGGTAQCIGS